MGRYKLTKTEHANTGLIAKNFLAGRSCDSCFYRKTIEWPLGDGNGKCGSLLRAKRDFNIKYINTPEWKEFKSFGLDQAEGKICEYWSDC